MKDGWRSNLKIAELLGPFCSQGGKVCNGGLYEWTCLLCSLATDSRPSILSASSSKVDIFDFQQINTSRLGIDQILRLVYYYVIGIGRDRVGRGSDQSDFVE